MTIQDLIAKLADYPPHTVVLVYDGDTEEYEPITGFVFTPGEGEDAPFISIYSNE